MAAIGNDREQNVVTGLGRTFALLDRLDPAIEHLLIGLEQRRRLGCQDLPPPGRDVGHLNVLPEILGHDDIGEGPEHGDQFRDVDEGGEAADRLVFAGWLDFELGRRVAEAGGPSIELVQSALSKCLMAK